MTHSPSDYTLTLTDRNAVSTPSHHSTRLDQHSTASLSDWILYAMSLDTEPSLPDEITEAADDLARAILNGQPAHDQVAYLDVSITLTPAR